jgi:hypothetical protein
VHRDCVKTSCCNMHFNWDFKFWKESDEYPKTTMKTRGYVKILIINMEGKI